MLLNAHTGTKYGIPFPVFVRASLGVRGANVPAILRALVACGWFGIQTWIGGQAIYSMLRILWPASANFHGAAWFCFFPFWCVNRSAARLWFSPSKIFFAGLAAQSPGVFPGLRRQTSCASLAVRAARRQLRHVAKEAGLNTKTICGGQHKNRYLLETTGCGVAFDDYDNMVG